MKTVLTKNASGEKLWQKQNISRKISQKKADFLCILILKLKWVATGSGWWENSENFFGDS